MKECRNCKHALRVKGTDAIKCRLKDRVLLSNKADNCDDYGDNGELRRSKAHKLKRALIETDK